MFKLYDNVLFKYSLPDHLKIKDKILNNLTEGNSIIDSVTKLGISKTDFHIQYKEKSQYFKILENSLQRYLHPILIKKFKCVEFFIQKAWYQQYTNSDGHSWHYHGDCNLIGVYFLELPDTNFKTQFRDMFRNKYIEYEAKEGDIVFTNALVLHQSPPLKSNQRKTVISLNYNIAEVDNNSVKVIK
jgi:hypothetical protein